MSHADASLWQTEQLFLDGEKKKFPDKFTIDKSAKASLLQHIGITESIAELPLGYLKYSPFDFIVEEILLDGRLVTADMAEPGPDAQLAGAGTIYADLVKVGISTLDAVQRIADGLKTDISKIGYAGIKDAVALTSQRISIRGGSLEAVKALSIPGVILKNIWEGKGVVAVGGLKGNRFTIFIRTDGPASTANISAQLERMARAGAMNYYGPQRFGAPRFLSHKFGMLMFRGDTDGLIRSFLTEESLYEWQYMSELRRAAGKHFGDWKKMREIFSALPYTFRLENVLLAELEKITDAKDNHKALVAISKQADMWAKAYASYLANLVLSEAAGGIKNIGKNLPLVLGTDKASGEYYEYFLRHDGAENFIQNLRKYPFIYIGKAPFIESRVHPAGRGVKPASNGIALSFDLLKGSYATTILMYLFDITGDIPVPEWVNKNEVDTKLILGSGSVKDVRVPFQSIVDQMLQRREGGEA